MEHNRMGWDGRGAWSVCVSSLWAVGERATRVHALVAFGANVLRHSADLPLMLVDCFFFLFFFASVCMCTYFCSIYINDDEDSIGGRAYTHTLKFIRRWIEWINISAVLDNGKERLRQLWEKQKPISNVFIFTFTFYINIFSAKWCDAGWYTFIWRKNTLQLEKPFIELIKRLQKFGVVFKLQHKSTQIKIVFPHPAPARFVYS